MKTKKSAGQSAPGRPFTMGIDARRGNGPQKGAPNAGRLPDEIRAACRAAFDERVPLLAAFADDAANDPHVRMKALDMLAKFGLGTSWNPVNNETEIADSAARRAEYEADRKLFSR